MSTSSPADSSPRADSDLLGGFGGGSFASYGRLLTDRDFRLFFFSTLTSSLGDWIGLFAILALTEAIVGGGQASRATAFAFSGVMIARILPIMILGPVAGVYADRWDRKRTLIATDIGRGIIMLVLPFSQDFMQLFVASFAVEALSMLFAPAKEATLPLLVPRSRLVEANQLNLTVTYGTLPLGGVLLAALSSIAGLFPDNAFLSSRPASVAIWANAVTFFVSAALFVPIQMPRNQKSASHRSGGPSAWDELIEGFRFIANHRQVRALVSGVMAAAFAGGALFTVAKLFVSVLGRGNTAFGMLVAATGVGMLAGLLLSAPAAHRFGEERVFAPGIGLGGLFAIVVGLMPHLWPAAIAAFVMGLGAGFAFVTGYTLLQQRTKDALRGRAFAAFNTGTRLAIFLSLVIAPGLAGLLGIETSGGAYEIGGVRITIMLGGAVAVLGAMWSFWQLEQAHAETSLGLDASREHVERPGLFIVFEGGEGAGKSTQIRLLRASLERAGCEVVVTREPGGTDVGERIRDLLLDPDGDMSPRTEALLYAAARAQHAKDVIRPALVRGAVVLCDRYVDSSVVYQGAARGLGEEPVEELNQWGTGGLAPNLVVLLDIDAETGLERAGIRRREGPDRFEAEGLRFHRRVNEAFRRRAAADPVRFLVVDADRPAEHVHADVADAVAGLVGGGEAQAAAIRGETEPSRGAQADADSTTLPVGGDHG